MPWMFVLGGTLTAAAPLRFGMHTFLGWGTDPITDRSAMVDERQEDEHGAEAPATLWVPTVAALLAAVGLLLFAGNWRLAAAGSALRDTAVYIGHMYGAAALSPAPSAAHALETSAVMHGLAATALALLLACTSVFRMRLPRALRLGAAMEGPLRPLRALQSGAFTDYVLWMMVGVAGVGAVCAVAFR